MNAARDPWLANMIDKELSITFTSGQRGKCTLRGFDSNVIVAHNADGESVMIYHHAIASIRVERNSALER